MSPPVSAYVPALVALAKESQSLQCSPCDLSNRGEITRMLPAAVKDLNALDVPVNVEDMDPDGRAAVMGTNLNSACGRG